MILRVVNSLVHTVYTCELHKLLARAVSGTVASHHSLHYVWLGTARLSGPKLGGMLAIAGRYSNVDNHLSLAFF